MHSLVESPADKGDPGLFAHLSTLVPGDEVFVDQEGGHRLRFVVESVESFSKAESPGSGSTSPTTRSE